ncbi:MAG: hypothetical protein Q4C95_10835 [Planctomycetia bacterium]|nr:hypothetical protein [Planctomycetia bacterium]
MSKKQTENRFGLSISLMIILSGLGILMLLNESSKSIASGQDSSEVPADSTSSSSLPALNNSMPFNSASSINSSTPISTSPNVLNNSSALEGLSQVVRPETQGTSLESLNAQEKQLIQQLQSLNYNDPNATTLQQNLLNQLMTLQNKIQQTESLNSFQKTMTQQMNSTANPYLPLDASFPNSANPALQPSGTVPNEILYRNNNLADNSIPFANSLSNPSYNPNIDPQALENVKEELTLQLKQLQQTLRALQPQDVILAQTLREQQSTLLNQLKGINDQIDALKRQNSGSIQTPDSLMSLNNSYAIPNVLPPVTDNNSGTLPGLMSSSGDLNATNLNPENYLLNSPNDATTKMRKANEAAQILREVGLNDLANQILNIIPQMMNPDFKEPVQNQWNDNPNLIDSINNPFQTVPSTEVTELKGSISELRSEIEKMSQELVEMNTQLKLLSRQAVSAPFSYPNETDVPAAPQNVAPISSDSSQSETLIDHIEN